MSYCRYINYNHDEPDDFSENEPDSPDYWGENLSPKKAIIRALHRYFYYHQYDEKYEHVFRSADEVEFGNIVFYED